jgi:hypothetical protein
LKRLAGVEKDANSFRIYADRRKSSSSRQINPRLSNRTLIGPSVISYSSRTGSILRFVNALPQLSPDGRAPRLNLADITPAVLRFEDGGRTQAQLEVISLTGGMLCVPRPVQPDSHVKLMFVTPTGPVLGTAEMLRPVSLSQQPFRFVALEYDDRRRLQLSIQSSFCPAGPEQEWIEKYRATLEHRRPEKKQMFSMPVAALALGMLSLGSAIYLFGIFNLHLK